jgi:hypothetical protein
MDVRDYFAGQALNGLIVTDDDYTKGKNIKKLASLSYQIADALLDAREHLSHPVLLSDVATPVTAFDTKNDKESKKNKKTKKSPADDMSAT